MSRLEICRNDATLILEKILNMKPTKSRMYCHDCGRLKTNFETEKKAMTFIKFNQEEISSESGYSPMRAYFCISCNAWHVTSKAEKPGLKSKTERVLDFYVADKENRARNKANYNRLQTEKSKELPPQLDAIEQEIDQIKVKIGQVPPDFVLTSVDRLIAKVDAMKGLPGSRKRRNRIRETLFSIKNDIGRLDS
jgi:hypothetical protein